MTEQSTKAPLYMELNTGTVDTEEGWLYINKDGDLVGAVGMGEVVEVVRTIDGYWIEV